MPKELYVFLISMVPVLELRASIPAGVAMGIPVWVCFLISIIGNILPVPFILLFIRKLIQWMKKIKYLDKIAIWLENKAAKNSSKVMKYSALGLFFFVALPLPGTGAWTGALVAAFMNMRFKYALPSIAAGVLCAGLIVSLISSGVFGALGFLL